MKDKKYLDKVIEHLVRGTRIDYDNDKIHYPFHFLPSLNSSNPSPSLSSFIYLFSSKTTPSTSTSIPFFTYFLSFTEYCKNTFGLMDGEIKYVWYQYGKILLNKIENGK